MDMKDEREKSAPARVLEYYVLANKLKTMLRTGWVAWEVEAPRLESIAEHVYGTLMLAIAVQSEYHYDLDFSKVLLMLALHETEEILIGDKTPFQTSREEKQKQGHMAVGKVFAPLTDKKKLTDLILEFDARETAEAKFAYFCDKLEADLQAKIYDEAGYIRLHGQEYKTDCSNDLVRELLESEGDWGKMFIKFTESYAGYDENFLAIDEYARTHEISK